MRLVLKNIFCLLIVNCLQLCTGLENWPKESPRQQHAIAGQRIALRCAGRVPSAPAHWDYKPCSNGEMMLSCAELLGNENLGMNSLQEAWKSLSHNRSSLIIKYVKVSDSGIYRCREAATEKIHIYSAVQLEVLSYEQEEDAYLPKFLEGLPENLTVFVGNQASFQCKVYSRSRPTILWLVEREGPLHYLGHSYNPVNSTGEMVLPGDIHVSKMTISDVGLSDEGTYSCIAINTKGFDQNSASLHVLTSDEGPFDSNTLEFYLLFLMPLALAVVPLVLWTCYVCTKIERGEHLDKTQWNSTETISGIDNEVESNRRKITDSLIQTQFVNIDNSENITP